MRDRYDALSTVLGVRKRGYFVPYRYAATADRRVDRYPGVEKLFRAKRAEIDAWIGEVGRHVDAFNAMDAGGRWQTRTLAPRDAAAMYALVRSVRPKRILEIGSGTSTWFMAKAVADGGLDCTITCIDPVPRQPIADLEVQHIARMLRSSDDSLAAELTADDILFIDSSHIMLPGMDVDIQFNRMFPRLARGVIVHVHDIFLPYDYPEDWTGRMYSEQNALIGWICSGYFDVVYPGYHASLSHEPTWEPLAAQFPPLANRAAGSLWLRRSQGGTR